MNKEKIHIPLHIVPTPIGNLSDITLRAIDTLKSVDFVIAEDTRVTAHLLKHLNISKPLFSNHAHNEHGVAEKIIEKLLQGQTAALVSDAGTPGISDPGYLLIRECIKNNLMVQTLPGPTAFVPALVNSGLPCDRFCFEGFLPQKKGRQTKLEKLTAEERTMVFYESPFRLVKTLEDFIKAFGDERRVSVSRELTKIFEETVRGTLKDVHAYFAQKVIKGEIVIILQGKQD